MVKVGLISLGCPKNTVDAEEILGEVVRAGHEIVSDPECADVLIVNTCGFIQSAKEESIEAVLDAVRYKTNGACRSVIVTGCLVQRYGGELATEIPEADAFLGLKESRDIAGVISRTLGGEHVTQVGDPSGWWTKSGSRVLSTPPWTAYLRIADGCDNRCSYCAIPSIRGGFRSRPETDILDEAKALADSGVKELNLVAQDITRYGTDAEGASRLPLLLSRLADITGIRWIRLLYCYPTRVSDDLIRAIAENEKVCKYIDIPLQHCADRMIRAMHRQGSRDEYLRLFDRVRELCPDSALRTTFIVGFPGETDEDFEELMDFARRVEFDRAGVFKYSAEEGTPAASMPDQIGKRIVNGRFHRLMELQRDISFKRNESLVGARMNVLVESIQGKTVVGRSHRDAPDIDGLVYISDANQVRPGDFVSIIVTEARDYDLAGKRL